MNEADQRLRIRNAFLYFCAFNRAKGLTVPQPQVLDTYEWNRDPSSARLLDLYDLAYSPEHDPHGPQAEKFRALYRPQVEDGILVAIPTAAGGQVWVGLVPLRHPRLGSFAPLGLDARISPSQTAAQLLDWADKSGRPLPGQDQLIDQYGEARATCSGQVLIASMTTNNLTADMIRRRLHFRLAGMATAKRLWISSAILFTREAFQVHAWAIAFPTKKLPA